MDTDGRRRGSSVSRMAAMTWALSRHFYIAAGHEFASPLPGSQEVRGSTPLGSTAGYCADAGIRAKAGPRRVTDSAKDSASKETSRCRGALPSLAGRSAAMAKTRRSLGSEGASENVTGPSRVCSYSCGARTLP